MARPLWDNPALAADTPTDFELLDAWRAGDQDAGGKLLERHFSSVYRFFSSKLHDHVEDVTQRTFLACVESRDRFKEDRGSTFRAFLFGIARNYLLRYFDERKRHNKRIEFLEVSVRDLGTSPSRVAAAREEEQLLLLALREIPVDFQITVELFFWEEMTIPEIAKVLEVAPGTVKSRLHRAKGMLREQIGAMEADPSLVDSTIHNLDKWAKSLRRSLGRDPEPSDG